MEYVATPPQITALNGQTFGIAFQDGTSDVYVASVTGNVRADGVVFRLFRSTPGIDWGMLDSIGVITHTGSFSTSAGRFGVRVFEYTRYSAATNLTLPIVPDGTRIMFKDLGGNNGAQASTFPLTLTPVSGFLMDGGITGGNGTAFTSYVLNDDRGFVELLFDGNQWNIIRTSKKPFQDNAAALRSRKRHWLYQVSSLTTFDPTTIGIPNLEDINLGSLSLAAVTTAVIEDVIYYTGYDGVTAGVLYGFNLRTKQSVTAANTPVHTYSSAGGNQPCVEKLVGVRYTIGGVATDYLFAVVNPLNNPYVELGTVVNGVYTQIYQISISGFTSSAQAAQATILTSFRTSPLGSDPPVFVFTDSGGQIFVAITNPGNSVVHVGTLPVGVPPLKSIVVDDNGYVYLLDATFGDVWKYRVFYNGVTWTAIEAQNVTIPTTGGEQAISMAYDGRQLVVMTTHCNIFCFDIGDPIGSALSMRQFPDGTHTQNIFGGTFGNDPNATTSFNQTNLVFDGVSIWCGATALVGGIQHAFIVRFSPDIGEPLILADTGLATSYYPRALAVDNTGQVTLALFESVGNKVWFEFAVPSLEDAQFDDLVLAKPPIITPFRANNAGSPYTLSITQSKVLVDVSGGAVSVTLALRAPDGFPQTIKNEAGDASANNITVNAPAGDTIESISAPGTYGGSALINTKSGCVTWQRDAILAQWSIISKF